MVEFTSGGSSPYLPTPRPWEEYIASDGYVYIVGPDNEEYPHPHDDEYYGQTQPIVCFGDMEEVDGPQFADIQLIVTAVNAYDTLLAVAKMTVAAHDDRVRMITGDKYKTFCACPTCALARPLLEQLAMREELDAENTDWSALP